MIKIKDINAQIELTLQQPEVKADFVSRKCHGRLQLPVGNKEFTKTSPVVVVNAQSYLYHIDFSFAELSQTGEIANELYRDDAIECLQELIAKGMILSLHEIGKGGIITALLEMNFPNTTGGMKINLKDMGPNRVEEILFACNPGVIVQVASNDKERFEKALNDAEIYFARIGYPCDSRRLAVRKDSFVEDYDIEALRKVWCPNFKNEPLMLSLGYTFTGKMPHCGKSGLKAAVQNPSKEMTKALESAGFDVVDFDGKFDDLHLIIYSDLDENVVNTFMSRGNTLAIKVQKNDENVPSRFRGIAFEETDNMMLRTLAYRKLAIWSHTVPTATTTFDGRHLQLDGILEASIFPEQWGWYPENRTDEVSPWIELFINASECLKRF